MITLHVSILISNLFISTGKKGRGLSSLLISKVGKG